MIAKNVYHAVLATAALGFAIASCSGRDGKDGMTGATGSQGANGTPGEADRRGYPASTFRWARQEQRGTPA